MRNKMKKLVTRASIIWYSLMMTTTNVLAKEEDVDVSSVTKPLDTIKTIFLAIAGAVGVIIIVKNLIELGTAIQDRDTPSLMSALKGLAGGFIVAAASTVLVLLGF